MCVAYRVLIVDDNASNVRLFSAALEIIGCPHDIAYDGLQAIERLKQTQYDAILLDYNMPGLDGMQVMEWLNAEASPNPFIVVTTADERAHVRERFIALGCDVFLLKPICVADLVHVVSAAANQSHASSAADPEHR